MSPFDFYAASGDPRARLTLPACLDDVRLKNLPSSAFYISNFITKQEEEHILYKIQTAPKPRWKQLSKRRLQTWPSDLTKNTLLENSLPVWLTDPIISRLLSCPLALNSKDNIFSDSPHNSPNHILINEYLPGQGIFPHKDGSAYHPVVCTISLGASLCLDIYRTNQDGSRENSPRWKIFQEPRSLLITTGSIYTDCMHGIADVEEDVGLNSSTIANWDLLTSRDEILEGRYKRRVRLSLTYRDVIKVSKMGRKLGIFGKG